jgi:hypothetical protein
VGSADLDDDKTAPSPRVQRSRYLRQGFPKSRPPTDVTALALHTKALSKRLSFLPEGVVFRLMLPFVAAL